MAKKILIGSLQYSPIFKSHCFALGNQCEKYGYSVKYLLGSEYKWMLSDKEINKTEFIANSKDIPSAIRDWSNYKYRLELKKLISDFNPNYIYFHNYHPFFNYYIAQLARKMGITFIQHVHEPYVEDKSVYKGTKRYWLYLFEFMQGRLLEKTDIAVISSKRALYLFNKQYSNFQGKKLLIPLMYEDLGDSVSSSPLDRKYILFIGPPVPAKSPETFLNLAEYSIEHNLGLNFLLITRKAIRDDRYLKNNLTIFYKDRISDEEIGYHQKRSLMAITPYTVATQSSVVLTSFMYGTPVISTDVGGLKEVINHLETGYLLSKDSSIEEWINGILFIKNNFGYLSANCRSNFIGNFSERNWPKYFQELFNLMKNSNKKLICEIGCGERKMFDGSIAVDIRRTAKTDVLADARKLPFKDGCFDHIYSSHVIEHFSHNEIECVLIEWIRVLKDEGVFELRCPDLRARALIFFLKPSWENVRNIYGGQDYPENYHNCGFTFGLLMEFLNMHSVTKIKRIFDGYKGIPFLPCDLHIKGIKTTVDNVSSCKLMS